VILTDNLDSRYRSSILICVCHWFNSEVEWPGINGASGWCYQVDKVVEPSEAAVTALPNTTSGNLIDISEAQAVNVGAAPNWTCHGTFVTIKWSKSGPNLDYLIGCSKTWFGNHWYLVTQTKHWYYFIVDEFDSSKNNVSHFWEGIYAPSLAYKCRPYWPQVMEVFLGSPFKAKLSRPGTKLRI